jgi:hypothetical protein
VRVMGIQWGQGCDGGVTVTQGGWGRDGDGSSYGDSRVTGTWQRGQG